MVIDGFMEENSLAPPSNPPPKNEIKSPNKEDLQEIWDFLSP